MIFDGDGRAGRRLHREINMVMIFGCNRAHKRVPQSVGADDWDDDNDTQCWEQCVDGTCFIEIWKNIDIDDDKYD